MAALHKTVSLAWKCISGLRRWWPTLSLTVKTWGKNKPGKNKAKRRYWRERESFSFCTQLEREATRVSRPLLDIPCCESAGSAHNTLPTVAIQFPPGHAQTLSWLSLLITRVDWSMHWLGQVAAWPVACVHMNFILFLAWIKRYNQKMMEGKGWFSYWWRSLPTRTHHMCKAVRTRA